MPHLVRKSTNEDGEVRNKRCARCHIAPEYAPRLHLRERAPCTRAFFRIPGDGEIVGVELCGGLSRTCRGGVDDIGVDVGLVRGQLVARKSFPFCQPWALQGVVLCCGVWTRAPPHIRHARTHARTQARFTYRVDSPPARPPARRPHARTHARARHTHTPSPAPAPVLAHAHKHKRHRQLEGVRVNGGGAQPWPQYQRQKSESASYPPRQMA